VVSRGGGYALSAGPGQLDVARFERLVAEGQAALGGGEAVAAGNRFREALALWRGPAFADVADVEPLAREGARLEELRLVAVEGRLEADLADGLYAEVTRGAGAAGWGVSAAGAAVAAADAGAVSRRAAGGCAGG
jgi:hypothetical protein